MKKERPYGVYILYDGQCAMCKNAVQIEAKLLCGPTFHIDARKDSDNPKVQNIKNNHLDIGDGIVIEFGGELFQGERAIKWLRKYGDPKKGILVKMLQLPDCTFGRKSSPDRMHAFNYARGAKSNIYHPDFGKPKPPIFKSIFGKSWDELPPVMHKHYASRPYTNDEVVVEGTLDVMSKAPLTWLSPIMRLMGQIPISNEQNVPVTVRFQSDRTTKSFHFNRTFNFKNSKPYSFKSRMVQIKDNEVIEIMRFGLGWKMLYLWDGEKVVLKHNGYALRAFGHFIPVPLTSLMGKGYAEEIAIDDDTFEMITNITHPWWGTVYQYAGRFKVINND